MNAALGLGLGHALDPVAAAFELKVAKRPLAVDAEGNLAKAAQLGGLHVHDLELPAHRFGEPAVHLVEVAREQGRLIAAGTSTDLDDQRRVVRSGLPVIQQVAQGLALLRLPLPQALDLRRSAYERISGSVSAANRASASASCRPSSRYRRIGNGQLRQRTALLGQGRHPRDVGHDLGIEQQAARSQGTDDNRLASFRTRAHQLDETRGTNPLWRTTPATNNGPAGRRLSHHPPGRHRGSQGEPKPSGLRPCLSWSCRKCPGISC